MTKSVSETWVNVYKNGAAWRTHSSPKDADFHSTFGGAYSQYHVRVEHRINGTWHRPPVGMRGRDASHWRMPTIPGWDALVKR